MVQSRENLVGKIFGKLTVLEQTEDFICANGKHLARWLCQCECGSRPVSVVGRYLIRGHTQSCGCISKVFHKMNPYDLTGEYGIGWTINTNQEFYFDLEDYDKIKDYCWTEKIEKNGYRRLVSRDANNKKEIRIHQVILGSNYDHINRNTFDNRKCNLRPASHSENMKNRSISKNNSSGITGVYQHSINKKWCSQIVVDSKPLYLGYFDSKEQAIITRLKAEKEYYGDFAPQKHLFEKYGV